MELVVCLVWRLWKREIRVECTVQEEEDIMGFSVILDAHNFRKIFSTFGRVNFMKNILTD